MQDYLALKEEVAPGDQLLWAEGLHPWVQALLLARLLFLPCP